ASARVGLRVVELTTVDGLAAAGELLRQVWAADSVDQVANPALLRALAHAGNYVVAGYRDNVMVGAAYAFLGGQAGEVPHLHSHVTGVMPGGQGAGVGFALKQHQRGWALARGMHEVRWTFDPLVRRNAYF